MEILISSDHRGFAFKKYILENFSKKYNITDLGPHEEKAVDYPDYAHKLCKKIDGNKIGILICGSGIGMSITANRYNHIRAALCRNTQDAISSREHNNANVLVIGSNGLDHADGKLMIEAFLNTDFTGGRHQNRINKINLTSEV